MDGSPHRPITELAADLAADLAIVGGGVAGTSLARAAARAGARVVVLESARSDAPGAWPGAGASTGPIAFLNPWRGRKGAADPRDRAGLDAFWRWDRALRAEGRVTGAFRSGLLRIPSQARQARHWRERAEADPDALCWRTPDEVPPPYRAPLGALFVRAGGFVAPAAWLSAVAASARDAGATLRDGVRVERIEAVPETAGTARWTVHGRTVPGGSAVVVPARSVALCTGAELPPAGSAPTGAAAWERKRGEIVGLDGAPALPWPLVGGVYAGTLGGRTWLGGGHRSPDLPPDGAASVLRRAAASRLPGTTPATAVASWSAVRAKAPDARPVVHEVRPGLWTFGAFAGRGFLCAAAEAEAWAGRIAELRVARR